MQDDAQEVGTRAWSSESGIFRDDLVTALFASVYSEIDSQNGQKAETLYTDTESEVEHVTVLQLQAVLLYHGYNSL